MKHQFKIFDWAGNDLTYYHGTFKDFESAEDHLCEFLGDDYETDRGEYFISPYLVSSGYTRIPRSKNQTKGELK